VTKRKFLVIAIIVCVALAVTSFIGGTVGAAITGKSPLSIFNISPPSPELAAEHPFPGLPITNTIVASWITILVLFGLFFASTRRMKLIPAGLQNFMEMVVETAANFIEDAAGKKHGRWFFPVCTTIFLFVIANAWINLVPGFETIKVNGIPLLRNANTDINVPLMLALVSGIFVEYWGFKEKGAPYLKTFINYSLPAQGFKQLFAGKVKAGFGSLFSGVMAIFAGILEAISHVVRIISFTFRLFGNMTAGIILTSVVIFIIPWVVPSIFYGLELLIGFVQAMIFAGLTLGFACAAVMAAEE
jgi:F-type H+-transporting ATPase subunit a